MTHQPGESSGSGDLFVRPGAGAPADTNNSPDRPLLSIVRGMPDGVDASLEVAVLTAVLASRGGPAEPEPAPVSGWAARDRLVHAPLAPGRDAWRASTLPR